MGKVAETAEEMDDIKQEISEFPSALLGVKEDVNTVLTHIDGFTDSARLITARLEGLSQGMSDHLGVLADHVNSDSATWAGWSSAQHEVDSETLTAFAPSVPALEKVHALLMAANEAIDEAVTTLTAADQVAEGAQAACAALPDL